MELFPHLTLNSNLSPPGKSQRTQEPSGKLWKAELSFLSFSRRQLTSSLENRPNVRCRIVASGRAQTEQQRPPWPRGSPSLNKHQVLNNLTTSQSHSLAPQTLTESLIHRPNKALSLSSYLPSPALFLIFRAQRRVQAWRFRITSHLGCSRRPTTKHLS